MSLLTLNLQYSLDARFATLKDIPRNITHLKAIIDSHSNRPLSPCNYKFRINERDAETQNKNQFHL